MERFNVTVLGKELTLSCDPDEKEKLLKAVTEVDRLMSRIQNSAPKMTVDRVALMAAIQLSKELQSVQSPDGPFQGLAFGEVKAKMTNINNLLDSAIDRLK
ncbi:cell division protein ZapA [Brackiella oedipodis]|uniref:cell division protein ZapA n=1 Tax=Brackiella oedipodis TaxID=124225 RepID=UPI000491CE7B|nr:cell division protein ZapA [Brackiella oedipodis]